MVIFERNRRLYLPWKQEERDSERAILLETREGFIRRIRSALKNSSAFTPICRIDHNEFLYYPLDHKGKVKISTPIPIGDYQDMLMGALRLAGYDEGYVIDQTEGRVGNDFAQGTTYGSRTEPSLIFKTYVTMNADDGLTQTTEYLARKRRPNE